MSLDEKLLLDELARIVNHAERRGAILRGLGATAIRSHSLSFAEKCPAIRRDLTDLDLIAYSKDGQRVMESFKECGYHQDRARAYIATVVGRTILENPDVHLIIDLFFDRLSYNHTLDLKGRLEQDPLTIPLADLFLEKTQIVQVNEKDVKDCVLLLGEHSIGEGDKEIVNVSRISKILSGDWGFYYTVSTNMQKIADYAKTFQGLAEDDRIDILSKIQQLRNAIEAYPKSFAWKMRARVGTGKKWYDDVEELYAGH